MQVWLPERKYPTPSGVRTFSDEMLRRVETRPGVRSASTVNTRPFLGSFLGPDVKVPGYVPPEAIEGGDLLTYRVVSSLYFETLRAELVQGRAFSTGDGPDGAAVAVVNEAAAARYSPDVEPIGWQFRPRFQSAAASWIPAARSEPALWRRRRSDAALGVNPRIVGGLGHRVACSRTTTARLRAGHSILSKPQYRCRASD